MCLCVCLPALCCLLCALCCVVDGVAARSQPAREFFVCVAGGPTGAMLLNSDPESKDNREAAAAAAESPAKRRRHAASEDDTEVKLTQQGSSGLTPHLTTASLDTENTFAVLGASADEGAASSSDNGTGASLELVLDTDAMPPPAMPRSSSSGGSSGGSSSSGGTYGRSASTERKRPPELALQPATPDANATAAFGVVGDFDGPFAMPPARVPTTPRLPATPQMSAAQKQLQQCVEEAVRQLRSLQVIFPPPRPRHIFFTRMPP